MVSLGGWVHLRPHVVRVDRFYGFDSNLYIAGLKNEVGRLAFVESHR